MTYELRKHKNAKFECPECHGHLTVKFGKFRGKPRRRCNECGKVFFVLEEVIEEFKIETDVRVGAYDGSYTVSIDKPFDEITYSDIKQKLPDKRIIGWCRVID